MADTMDSQLIVTLDGLDGQWSGRSPARIRSLLRQHGFIVSEKRAKALKAGVLCSRVEVEAGVCELWRRCRAPLQSLYAGEVLQQRVPARTLEGAQAFVCTTKHAFSHLYKRSTFMPCV